MVLPFLTHVMVFFTLFAVGDGEATGELEALGFAVGVGVASTVFVGVGVGVGEGLFASGVDFGVGDGSAFFKTSDF